MDEKTTVDHWNTAWTQRPRPRPPSGLEVGTRNVQQVLRRHVSPGMEVLEIGCAPGKMLSWVATALDAKISGIDYSPRGIETTRWLLGQMKIDADIREENIFATSFEPGSFDVVYSNGVIEHFTDPRELVAIHVRLLRPGGIAVILVPHYGGVYGRLQRHFDPENLSIHNLDIMSEAAMRSLAPSTGATEILAYGAGRPSPWIVSWHRRWGSAGRLFSWMANMLSLALPVNIPPLAPLLALEIRRSVDSVLVKSDASGNTVKQEER